MTITRRGLMAGSLAMASLHPFSRALAAPLPRQVDVAVVGGGAAGIAAARRIAAAGRKVLIIEAQARLGGRCVTDVATFGVPFDRGARWLYDAAANPLAGLAGEARVDLAPAPRGQKIRIGRRNARAGESEQFLALLVRSKRAIVDAARGPVDLPAAAALPQDLGEWRGTADFLLGALTTGCDLADISAADLASMQPRDPAAMCAQGLGTLLANLAQALPVALSCPVTRIAWSGRDAQIETEAGTIAARAVIVTVSTAVLNAGKIKFAPDLPKRHLDAASRLGLGSSDHIALELEGNPLDLAHDDVVIEQSRDNRTGLLLANAGGSSLCQVDVAGAFGRDLSAQGEAAMVAFAREWLGDLFGGDLAKAVRRASATRWNEMPYVMGAMSAARPGGQPSRKILMEPLGPLFFAGEAVHETQWGTLGGAWNSGLRAADAALRRIGALKPEPAAAAKKPAKGTAKSKHRKPARRPPEPVAPPQRGLFWPGNRW